MKGGMQGRFPSLPSSFGSGKSATILSAMPNSLFKLCTVGGNDKLNISSFLLFYFRGQINRNKIQIASE
uniref:Uncharacterized protein n=1 Tax=Rhizophora mucronata TaxID=61149 RepID=A0A2P2QID6_RHIMU